MAFRSSTAISSYRVSRNNAPGSVGIDATRELLGPFADEKITGFEEQQEIAVGSKPRYSFVMDLYKGTQSRPVIRRTVKVPVPEFKPTTFPSLINAATERNSARLIPMRLKNGSNVMNISEDPIGYSDSAFEKLLQRSNCDSDESVFEMELDDDECEPLDYDPNPEVYFAHLQPKINAALKRARETGLREILPGSKGRRGGSFMSAGKFHVPEKQTQAEEHIRFVKKKMANFEPLAATKGPSAKIRTKSKNLPESGAVAFSANVRDFKVNPAHAHLFQIDPTNGEISITPRRHLMIPANVDVGVEADFNANFEPDQESGPVDMTAMWSKQDMVDKCLQLPQRFVKGNEEVPKVPTISKESSPEAMAGGADDETMFPAGLPHPFGSFDEWRQHKQLKEKADVTYSEQKILANSQGFSCANRSMIETDVGPMMEMDAGPMMATQGFDILQAPKFKPNPGPGRN